MREQRRLDNPLRSREKRVWNALLAYTVDVDSSD
jgi:hypothetical protein